MPLVYFPILSPLFPKFGQNNPLRTFCCSLIWRNFNGWMNGSVVILFHPWHQSFGLSEQKHLRYISIVLFVAFVWPSVCGWYAEPMLNEMPCSLNNSCQNLLKKNWISITDYRLGKAIHFKDIFKKFFCYLLSKIGMRCRYEMTKLA